MRSPCQPSSDRGRDPAGAHRAGATTVRLKADATYEAMVRLKADATYEATVRLKADATYEATVRLKADATYEAALKGPRHV